MIFPEARSDAAKGEAQVVKTSFTLGWRRLEAKVYRLSPGDYAWHATTSHRLFIHLGGRARIRLRGGAKAEAQQAQTGLVWLSPAGKPNAGLEIADGDAEMLQLLTPAEPARETALSHYGIALESLIVVERNGIKDPVLEALGRSILAELEAPTPAGAFYADTVAATLSAHILRRHSRASEPPPAEAVSRHADSRLERVIAYIEQNLEHELSLETLSREASLSLYHFARSFKTATGFAPHRFVLNRRIERARTLLRDPEIPIATVALRCGFASQAHLTHVFRGAIGFTPGAFRAMPNESAESV